MSFILDALKKSESERKRQDSPGIASIPESSQPKPAAKWPWVVTGLLAVNLVVLGTIVMKPEAPVEPASDASVAPEPDPEPATVPESQPVTEARETTTRRAETPVAAAVEMPAPEPEVETVAAVTPEPLPTITEGLPTLRELQAAGQLQLPEMHLDIHVYSGQPADRFVFVNMSKYTEGSTLNEGPSITDITPDGVVLDYFGTRFLLPRE